MSSDARTMLVERPGRSLQSAPRFRARVLAGPDAGTAAESQSGALGIGTAEGVALRLTDPTVSRYHAEIEAGPRGLVIRDLDSTNGTFAGGLAIREIIALRDVELVLGKTRVAIEVAPERDVIDGSASATFGRLIGSSAAMRAVFNVLERAAPTSAPVLITGESGTGKELAARAVHETSPRAQGPFEIVDCGGLPPTLIESELFGHERGAYTGAVRDRSGAFERAHGGTLFLDELGELPLELQPKLLRALGEQEVRRLGATQQRKIDVRIVAATNRDLRRDVNAGRFRSDLFYRLAVVQVRMPRLRDRLEDLPALVSDLLQRISREHGLDVHLEPDASLLEPLNRHAWPGNVRELRNYLEQLAILRAAPPLEPAALRAEGGLDFGDLERLPWRNAKDELVERFERHYLGRLLGQTQGNVAEAARRAGVDRGTLFRSIRRHGLRDEE